MLDTSNEATDGTILDGQSHVRTQAEAAIFVMPQTSGKQSIASPHLCSHLISQTRRIQMSLLLNLTY